LYWFVKPLNSQLSFSQKFRTDVSKLAPIAVVMLLKRWLMCVGATFERKAGRVYLQSLKASLLKNQLENYQLLLPFNQFPLKET